MLLGACVLSSLVLVASAYQCNGTSLISAPSDLSKPVYYPAGWSEGQDLPQVDPDQGCSITVDVPPGVFATVTFYKHYGSNSGVYVLYSNNNLELLADDDHTPYIFTAPHFTLNVGTSDLPTVNKTGFAFKLQYAVYPQFEKNIVDIYKGKPPVVVNGNDKLTTFIGSTNAMISLVAFSLKDRSMNYLLRQSAIFAGDSVNGTFIGTLEQVVASRGQFTTYKNKMSVYTFGLSQTIDYPLFLAQDSSDSSGIYIYEGANCPSTGNCNVTMNGIGQKSYTVTSYNGPEIIKDFNVFLPTGVVTVYENTVSNTTLVATLSSSDYRKQLPLQVNGVLKYYVLNGVGDFEMVLTRDTSRASRH